MEITYTQISFAYIFLMSIYSNFLMNPQRKIPRAAIVFVFLITQLWGVMFKVVDSVPFWQKWMENLVPICKLIRGNPPFHLGSNFGVFRVISASMGISAGLLFVGFFFSLSSQVSTSLISPPPTAASQQGARATTAPPPVHQALAISPWEHGGRSTVFPFLSLSLSLLILF